MRATAPVAGTVILLIVVVAASLSLAAAVAPLIF
jgi:hypothetical protein